VRWKLWRILRGTGLRRIWRFGERRRLSWRSASTGRKEEDSG
jgi:hypothetical protein